MKAIQVIFLFLICITAQGQQDTLVQKRTARSFVRAGNELYNQQKNAEAAISYKKAVEASATYIKGAYNLGNALYAQKNYKEAIPQYELALKGTATKKEKGATYFNIGKAHMAEKNFDKAVEAFKNSLRNNPTDDEARYNLAHAQKMLKKQQEQDEQNKQPPPSEFAKREKKKADKFVNEFKFEEALKLLDAALEKDMTVSNYKEYMEHLQSVIEIEKK